MAAFFQAGFPVIALVCGIVCIVAAIIEHDVGIAPFMLPAIVKPFQRVAIGLAGAMLIVVATWSPTSMVFLTWLWDQVPSQAFTMRYNALVDHIEKNYVAQAIRSEGEGIYYDFKTPTRRCKVIVEFDAAYPSEREIAYYPPDILTDAVKFVKGSADTTDLKRCGSNLTSIAKIAAIFTSSLAASASTRASIGAVTGSKTREDTLTRVLTAVTLPGDSAWVKIPRGEYATAGQMLSTTGDKALYASDPAQGKAALSGYLLSGASVDVLKTTTQNNASYALVQVVATPASAVGCTGLPATSSTLFAHCGEATVDFGAFTFSAYTEHDTHKTVIHFRSIGPRPVLLSVFPDCDQCTPVSRVQLLSVSGLHDDAKDFMYTAQTTVPFRFGWTISLETNQTPQPTR